MAHALSAASARIQEFIRSGTRHAFARDPWLWFSLLYAIWAAIFAGLLFLQVFGDNLLFDTYPDFIAGYVAITGGVKIVDYYLVCVWVVAFVIIFPLSVIGYRRLVARCAGDDRDLLRVSILICLPAALYALSALGRTADIRLLIASVVAVLALPLCRFVAWRYDITFARGQLAEVAIVAWAIAIFSFALPVLINLVSVRIFLNDPDVIDPWTLPAMVTLAAIGAAVFVNRSLRNFLVGTKWVVLLLQAPLPLLILITLPQPLQIDDRLIWTYGARPALWVLIVVFVLAAWLSLARRCLRSKKLLRRPVSELFDPLCMSALAVYLVYPAINPWLPIDDFHFGESLYGWHQWLAFGLLPAIDVKLIHGFIDILPGLVGGWFYSGVLATMSPGQSLLSALSVVLLVAAFSRIVGTGWALVLVIILSGQHRFTANTPIYFAVAVLMSSWLIARPALWLAVWGVSSLIIIFVLYSAVAFITASIPFVGYMMWITWRRRDGDRAGLLTLGLVAVGVLIVLAVTPFGKMALAIASFISANAKLNALGYGIPLLWEQSSDLVAHNGSILSIPVFFHLVRFAWLPLAIGGAFLLIAELGKRTPSPPKVWAWLMVSGVTLFFVPYALGRVDPGHLSRLGILTGITAVLAAIALAADTQRKSLLRPFLALVIVSIGSLPTVLPPAKETLANLQVASDVQADLEMTDKLGWGPVAFADRKHLQRIVELRSIFDQVLEPKETFYEASNRTALYFYLNRPMPTAWASYYNEISTGDQARTVQDLKQKRPPLVMLGPGNYLDYGKPSLRMYWVYRYLMQAGYVPRRVAGYDFLVSPDRVDRIDGVERMVRPALLNDANWRLGVLRSGNAFVADAADSLAGLRAGDRLNFAGSGIRTIASIDGARVNLDTPIDPDKDGFPHVIGVKGKIARVRESDIDFYDRVFGWTDVGSLAQSWGRSWRTLERRVRPVASLDVSGPAVRINDAVLKDGIFQVTGSAPYVEVPLKAPLPGDAAGMVTFRFECVEGPPPLDREYLLRVYWRASEFGLTEQTMVQMRARGGMLAAPLDHQPRWLLSRSLTHIRFDLARSAGVCNAFRITEAQLVARDDFGR
jgi:hypothetical protein